MKKLLLILLCLPMIGFGQELGIKKKINKNGIYLSFKEPKNWEETKQSFANDQSNLAVSYLNRSFGAMFQIYIASSPKYVTKKEAEEFMNDEDFKEDYVRGFEEGGINEIIAMEKSYVNDYPAIEILSYGYSKMQKQVQWVIFYEDKMINIQGVSLSDEFNNLYLLFKNLKNSVYFE